MEDRNLKKPLILVICLLFLSAPAPALAKTVHVPTDASTITAAVAMAQDGDTILVDDGLYLEDDIIIDKKLHLKAKNIYRAVIQGSGNEWHAIFIIRAPVEIEGFVLKNADWGILQRGSPDCSWTAHDLVILNMIGAAVYINDRESNIGRGRLFNIFVDNSNCAFSTNDAHSMDVKNCFISNCKAAFAASNHLSFRADRLVVLRCKYLIWKDIDQPPPPGTNEINFGQDLISLDRLLKYGDEGILSAYEGIFRNPSEGASYKDDQFEILKTFALNIIGDVYFKMKDYDKALRWNQEALDISQKLKSPDTEWNALYSLGRIFEEKGQYSQALALYKKAVEVIEGIRTKASPGLHRSGLMRGKIEIFESMVHLCLKMHEASPSEGYDRMAFHVVERAKARMFLDMIEEARIGIDIHLDHDMSTEKARIRRSLAKIQNALKNPYLAPKKRQHLLEDLARQESLYDNLLIRIRRSHPEFSDLLRPQPYTYEEIKNQLLDQETVLLEYFWGHEYVFAFLATNSGLYSARLPAPDILAEYVRNYHFFLELDMREEFKGMKGARRLYDLIIRPFEDKIPKDTRRMIIVPCGELYNLPFETLIRGERADRGDRGLPDYLVHDYEISYAASTSSLINLRKRQSTGQPGLDLLAVANPNPGSGQSILRYAAKEARRVSSFFDRGKSTLLLNKKAKESRFKALDTNQYKVVHIVAHALIDNENWWRSSLLLVPEKNLEEDGLLQPQEVYNLDLNADLVVLSACRSSLGRLEEGEGLLGFVRAFLYAGASSVLSSQWKVDDEAAPAFMGMFFRHVSSGRTVSQALRLAKLEMLASAEYSHPFYWASFIATGDAEVLINTR